MKPSLILKLIGTIWKTKRRGSGGVETRHEGQSTLDECVPEYGRGSGERKRCVANLARLCTMENLPLCRAPLLFLSLVSTGGTAFW